MAMGDQPDLSLARRVLPAPLLRALQHVFAQGLSGCMLVGGTALAGFYAGHRRSDDLDLFTETGEDQSAAVLAVPFIGVPMAAAVAAAAPAATPAVNPAAPQFKVD